MHRQIHGHILKIAGGGLALLHKGLQANAEAVYRLHTRNNQMGSLSENPGLHGPKPQQHPTLPHRYHDHEGAEQGDHEQDGQQLEPIKGIANATGVDEAWRERRRRGGHCHVNDRVDDGP